MAENTNVTQQDGGRNVQHNGHSEGARQEEVALMPPVDVIEDSSGITLLADMPGVSREKLTLELETDSLTILGEVAMDIPQDMESSYAEVKVPRYRRVFTLSKELDGEKATAELINGVLKLRIPKVEQAQPRRIQINVG